MFTRTRMATTFIRIPTGIYRKRTRIAVIVRLWRFWTGCSDALAFISNCGL